MRFYGRDHTFHDLTCTPLDRTRTPQLWIRFAECLTDDASVHRTAQGRGIHRNTVLRWQHKLLRAAGTQCPR